MSSTEPGNLSSDFDEAVEFARAYARKFQPPPSSHAFESVVRAAATVGAFEPDTFIGNIAEQDQLRLLSMCTIAEEEGKTRWSLSMDVRRQVLAELVDSTATLDLSLADAQRRLNEAKGNQDELTLALQSLLKKTGLPDERPGLSAMTREQIAARRTAIACLPSGFIDVAAEVRRIDLEEILEPFRHLTGYDRETGKDLFVGRTDELKTLRSFVGTLQAEGLLEAAARRLDHLIGKDAVLVMSGIGGIGKSTLLAKFLLQHVEARASNRPAFAYLDLDRSTLSAVQPATLLLELSRQLEWQLDDAAPALRQLRADIRDAMESSRLFMTDSVSMSESGFYGESEVLGDVELPAELLQAHMLDMLVQRLAHVVTRSIGPHRSVLLVIDTFEEAQMLGDEAVFRMERLVGKLVERMMPSLRVVLSGRDDFENFFGFAKRIELKEFSDVRSRTLFLERRGVPPEQSETVARALNGRPLTLLLAARLVKEIGPSAIKLRFGDTLKATLNKQLIDGVLYGRILDHVPNEDVRRLVHPGLALRRLDFDVVKNVIVPVLGLQGFDDIRIQNALRHLRRQKDLVVEDDDGSLRHRADVRIQMIELMALDAENEVPALHRAACAYYVKRQRDKSNAATMSRDRIEELYHTLALGEELSQVVERWIPRARVGLASSLPELARPESRGTLKAMLGRSLNDDELASVPGTVKQINATRQAQRKIAADDPVAARELLRDCAVDTFAYAELFAVANDRAGFWQEAANYYSKLDMTVPKGIRAGRKSSAVPVRGAMMIADFYERFSGSSPQGVPAVFNQLVSMLEQDRGVTDWKRQLPIRLALQRLVQRWSTERLRVESLLFDELRSPGQPAAWFLSSRPTNDDRWSLSLSNLPEVAGPDICFSLHMSEALNKQLSFLITELRADLAGDDGDFVLQVDDFCQTLLDASDRVIDSRHFQKLDARATGFVIRHLLRPATPQWYVPLASQVLRRITRNVKAADLLPGRSPITVGIPEDAQYGSAQALAAAFGELDQFGLLSEVLDTLRHREVSAPENSELQLLINEYQRWRGAMFGRLDAMMAAYVKKPDKVAP